MSDNDEFIRIHVPHPDTELVLGIRDGNTNFSGIMGRVADGGVFLGAGGYPGGMPSADSNYDGFKKAHTTLNVAIGALSALALVFRSAFLFTDVRQGAIDGVINAGVFIGAGATGVMAGIDQGTSAARGNVSLYGDSSVALVSPITVSLTAGVSGSVNALLASVNGVVSASVNALLASVNGTITASVNGMLASVTGDTKATLAARSGEANVLGKLVNIGKATSGDAPLGINAALGALLGKQKATRRVTVEADQEIALEAGTLTEKLTGTGGVSLSKESVDVYTKSAAVKLRETTARLQSGNSTVIATPSGASLAYMPAPLTPLATFSVMTAHAKAIEAAQKAYDEATHTNDLRTTGLIVGGVTAAAAAGAAGAAAGGVGAGKAAGLGAGATAGISIAAAAVGAELGGSAVLGLSWLIRKTLAGKALDAAKLAADTARKGALAIASKLEETTVQSSIKLPASAVVETGPSGIKLAYMGSQITITAAGIDIKTPGTLTLNGATISTTGVATTSMS